ncbi:MAG: carboxylating nicotinate-nucleotide diphosphorylase [Bacteroidales bacterium]
MEAFHNMESLIKMALEEDLRDIGDITSDSIFKDENYVFKLISKDSGILCGIEIFRRVMQMADCMIRITNYFYDGNQINKGDVVAEVAGQVRSILRSERTALNFISMLSAVATRTSEFVKKAEGKVIILDTRKTIPGYRQLQKYAVKCGGGHNHRMGLYDMVMIKDNHIDAAGGIRAAVDRIREKWGNRFRIEVEARNISEVKEAITCRVDRIMLDNMSNSETAEAVKLIGGISETEASGNITTDRIKSVGLTGVDFLSAGELTNSIKAFDFSLKKK